MESYDSITSSFLADLLSFLQNLSAFKVIAQICIQSYITEKQKAADISSRFLIQRFCFTHMWACNPLEKNLRVGSHVLLELSLGVRKNNSRVTSKASHSFVTIPKLFFFSFRLLFFIEERLGSIFSSFLHYPITPSPLSFLFVWSGKELKREILELLCRPATNIVVASEIAKANDNRVEFLKRNFRCKIYCYGA